MASKWVSGTKAPVDTEVDLTRVPVEGIIPPKLAGRLVRMGPNPIGAVRDDYQWFSGDGMVHAIDLADGSANRFVNRWVRTREVSGRLGEPTVVPSGDADELSNTSAFFLWGQLYGLTEGCPPYRLDTDLRTVGREDFGAGIRHFTAHPHTDPATREVLGIGYSFDDDPSCTLYVIGQDGTLTASRKIDLLGPRSVHDFAFTRDHVVLWDLPLELDREMVDGGSRVPFGWNPDGGARVGVLDRHDLASPVRWFGIDPCWAFHPLNAHATEGGVTIDVCQYDRIADADRTGPGDTAPPQLWRWTIDDRRPDVRRDLIDDRIQEFPRIDDRFWGLPHRFGVTVELFSSDGSPSIITHDIVNGSSESWQSKPGRSLSEAVFVADSASSPEGEGWLLAIESDRTSSDLVVLDATAVSAGPVARVHLPQRIPDGFHGDWLAAELH